MKIKKLVLSIFCLFTFYSAFAQLDGNYDYSIGIRGYSFMQLPKILNHTDPQEYVNSYLNGVMIKFNDNQISFRLNGNYLKKDLQFTNQCENCEVAVGKVRDYSFKVGFEKSTNYSQIQPYFGADIGFRSNNFNGEIKTTNPISTQKPYNVIANKNVSFFVESSVDFFYSYERQETIQQNAENTRTFVKYNKWEFLLNPISAGIQIHFINKN